MYALCRSGMLVRPRCMERRVLLQVSTTLRGAGKSEMEFARRIIVSEVQIQVCYCLLLRQAKRRFS